MKKILVLLTVVLVALPAAASGSSEAGQALKLRNTRYGPILFDANDRVLTGSPRQAWRKSTCYAACAAAWPVYFSKGRVRAMRGVKQSLIGTVRRRNGRLQVTYNGWPLYFYAREGPREVKCQNVNEFGGLWLVVKASGRLVR